MIKVLFHFVLLRKMMYDVKIQIDYNFFLRISLYASTIKVLFHFVLWRKMIHDVKILIELFNFIEIYIYIYSSSLSLGVSLRVTIKITQVRRDPVSPDAFRSQSCKDRCRDRVTFYDPRFVVEYSWFTLWPNYHERRRSPLSFSKNEPRVRGFSRRALSISRFDDNHSGNALKRKNCTDNFSF